MRILLSLSFIIILSLATAACSIFQKGSAPLPQPEMVQVEGGNFTMGDIAETQNSDALPLHRVTLSNFLIGKYEVTVSEYNAFAKRTDRKQIRYDSTQSGNIPAINVTWRQAKAYCNYFGYRLPTEQEWEYAARSGGKRQRFSGISNPDSLHNFANVDQKKLSQPLPVGLKKPNTLGLYDMSGNAFEWIGAYYQRYPQNGNSPDWDNLDKRILRIIRGGSYDQPPAVASTYWRAGMLHNGRASDVGFRCAADVK